MPFPLTSTYTYDGRSWHESNVALDALQQEPYISQSCLIFLNRSSLIQNDMLRFKFEKSYGIPDCFWTTLCARHNGYFGCEDTFDPEGKWIGHNTWFRFQIKLVKDVSASSARYKWTDLTFHTVWLAPGVHHVLCFDIAESFRQSIVTAFEKIPATRHASVYTPHCFLIPLVVEAYDSSVWALRDRVRDIEQRRMGKTRPETDYPLLHELTRHACHSSETLSIAVEILAKIYVQYESLLVQNVEPAALSQPILQNIDFQLSLLRGLHARSRAVETRLSNELNLKINMVAQEESRATVDISRAAQSDGAAMKAVAVVTLLFLPSTFVSTIFSMTFFNYNPGQGWVVSGMIWLYFLFTVPLTVIAMCSWIWWQRKHKP